MCFPLISEQQCQSPGIGPRWLSVLRHGLQEAPRAHKLKGVCLSFSRHCPWSCPWCVLALLSQATHRSAMAHAAAPKCLEEPT